VHCAFWLINHGKSERKLMPRNQAVESQYSTQNPVPENSVDEA
jgi:hypothetical protein